jgi:sirohydrochlorin ferrochelatase
MTTPKDEMIAALDALGALNDGQGLPPWSDSAHHIFSVRSVEALIPIIAKHNQELAQEFRRLAAEAQEARNERDSDEFAFWDGKRETWTQAAQMLEERLNG